MKLSANWLVAGLFGVALGWSVASFDKGVTWAEPPPKQAPAVDPQEHALGRVQELVLQLYAGGRMV
jgi:hypothetical protein